MMKLLFQPERTTKNTIRFQEKTEAALDAPAIGTLYVQKTALKELGYQEGKTLQLTLEVK